MRKHRVYSLFWFVMVTCALGLGYALLTFNDVRAEQAPLPEKKLDQALQTALANAGFSGSVESTLEARLGRPVNRPLANIGRLLWFDTITGLNNDNTCAGCHSPTNGFGDTQSIAIGIDNNGIVGPDRKGPRNMRRTPMAINTAFYPNLMWNSRFRSLSGDPFDPSAGFLFPKPEGTSLSYLPDLLTAQAFIPPTERTEVVGMAFHGDHDAIRAAVLNRLNNTPAYRRLFALIFPTVKYGAPITFTMFGQAIAEFEFTLTFANAPVDRYARGERTAMTAQQKKGALLFFGQAGCVTCHAVGGASNEMFSDFQDHDIGVPQIVPIVTNNIFDGSHANQDYGRQEITNDPNDRYKFRTSPLRNIAVQAAYMHNGAFTSIRAAIQHHLDVVASAENYSPELQSLASDLCGPMGPLAPVLQRIDPLLNTPIRLSSAQLSQLVEFVRFALLDPRAKPENLRALVPPSVPSGRPVLKFEFP